MESNRPDLRIVEKSAWNEPAAYRPDLVEQLRLTERERKALDGYREPVLDRVASALGSDRLLFIEIGFVLGCFTTVGLAFCWSVLS
jgi:hypothetical protein